MNPTLLPASVLDQTSRRCSKIATNIIVGSNLSTMFQHCYQPHCWIKLFDDVGWSVKVNPTLLPASVLDQTSRRCSNIATSIIVGLNFSTMFQHCYQHHCWIKLLDDVGWSVKVNPTLLPASVLDQTSRRCSNIATSIIVGSNFSTMFQHCYQHHCWIKLLDDVPTLLSASLLDQTSR